MTRATPPSPAPTIEGFSLGPFETNCYIVSAPPAPECWIVDAGFEPAELIGRVRELALRPVALLLTHAHVDHIAGVGEVRAAFPKVPIYLHPSEAAFLGDPMLNLSGFVGMEITAPGPDRALNDGDTLDLGATKWTVLHTPGHSPGGVTLHCPDHRIALVGDTLFNGSIGRSDFPTSDEAALHRSIRERLYTLPDETVVYPGHGPPTSIGREKRSNPFVRP